MPFGCTWAASPLLARECDGLARHPPKVKEEVRILYGLLMKEISFNDSECVELATAYGTLKTRILRLELDIRGPAANISLGELHQMLLDRWGFDLSDLIEIRLEPEIRRITFSQKWWDRSERKHNK